MIKRLIIMIALAITCAVSLVEVTAKAEGGVNAAEQRVVTAARGSFEYEGEKYVAKPYFVDQLIAYLSREDIDLTEAQADKAISQIHANVETGVKEGYIVKIHDDKDEKETPAPEGRVVKEEDGSVKAYDHYGRIVMKSDGLLRNTGYSLHNVLIALVVLAGVFMLAVIYVVKDNIKSGGKHYES